MEQQTNEARKLAEEHVDWFLQLFLQMVRPLLISFMEHGIKHGEEDKEWNNKSEAK